LPDRLFVDDMVRRGELQQSCKVLGTIMLAWSQVHSVTGNEAGVWTAGTTQADYDELVRLIGLAKTKVSARYYKPNFILASEENSEVLSNWEGFTRAGFPNAVLNSAGFAGSVRSRVMLSKLAR
jgi:hypothetical protein